MICLMRKIMIRERAHQGSYKPDRGIMWTVENNGVLAIIKPFLHDIFRLWGGYENHYSHNTFQVKYYSKLSFTFWIKKRKHYMVMRYLKT